MFSLFNQHHFLLVETDVLLYQRKSTLFLHYVVSKGRFTSCIYFLNPLMSKIQVMHMTTRSLLFCLNT